MDEGVTDGQRLSTECGDLRGGEETTTESCEHITSQDKTGRDELVT